MTRLLVVAALKSELHADRAGDGVNVIYGGVGKINRNRDCDRDPYR
jgi:hypothetical protein